MPVRIRKTGLKLREERLRRASQGQATSSLEAKSAKQRQKKQRSQGFRRASQAKKRLSQKGKEEQASVQVRVESQGQVRLKLRAPLVHGLGQIGNSLKSLSTSMARLAKRAPNGDHHA